MLAVKRDGHPDSALEDLIFGWEQHHNLHGGLYPLVVALVELAARIDGQRRIAEAVPAFFCKRCGWSEDPTNPLQVSSSDVAFHSPCPAPAYDPGMAF
jgi:hypothetical protein